MIGLESFNEDQLLRFARLVKADIDFKEFVNYLTGQVTALALKSTRHAGDEGEKLKGACIALAELRDLLVQAPNALQLIKDDHEAAGMNGRDNISP
jgi:hypothetical protein